MTENDPHATADLLCGEVLDRVVLPGWHIQPGKPIRIPGLSSKPEPDRSVVGGAVRDHTRQSPGESEIAMVVEVSPTSLVDDRALAGLYGRAGIPVYWIVNVMDGQVEVYSRPSPSG